MERGAEDMLVHLSDAANSRPLAVLPPVDLEKYRRHVDHLDMPEERKTELLRSLYAIMRSFVDRAFGDDPVQHCLRDAEHVQAKDETGIPPVIHFSESGPTTLDKDLSAAFHEAGKRGRRKR